MTAARKGPPPKTARTKPPGAPHPALALSVTLDLLDDTLANACAKAATLAASSHGGGRLGPRRAGLDLSARLARAARTLHHARARALAEGFLTE